MKSFLRPGENCWRIEAANRASVVIDAADYYRFAKAAMIKAKRQILMIGWDFDTRIFLDREGSQTGAEVDAPNKLGPFTLWLARRRPELRIYILKWDVGSLKMLGRGSTLLTAARWAMHKQITFKLDGAHPPGASHHQKIVIIDDALAFCGGIDMTANRWDTRAHRPDDPDRKRPTTGRRYGPWHDATMALDGPAAKALGELARARWEAAGGEPIAPPETGSDPWPDGLAPAFKHVSVAIARTRGAHGNAAEIREIERLFLDQIAAAERFIYAESQYFASRAIAEAIGRRLREANGPEVVVVNPETADGWLEEEVMGPARSLLMQSLAKVDRYDRFRIYTPVNAAGEPIYVHAKIMIVDDRMLRVGSANMNNRSLGFDSECDVVIDAALPENAHAARLIERLRLDLMAEHLGVEPARIAACQRGCGSLIGTIERLRGAGRSLVPFVPPEPNGVEEALADSEWLDPESAVDMEPLTRGRLLRRLDRIKPAHRRRRSGAPAI